jgi:alpha-aminoadipate/glutamate carrier protein LysW
VVIKPIVFPQDVSGSDAFSVRSRCRIYQVLAIIRTSSRIATFDGAGVIQEYEMATCPECDAEIEVDEYDVDKGDLLSCPECGSNLEVAGLAPLELDLASEDEEDDDDDEDDVEDEDEVGEDDVDEDEDAEEEEDWDE